MTCCLCWTAPTTKDAYRLAVTSIIVTILAAVGGLVLYASSGSSLALVYGLENVVDFLTDAVVCWRFFAPTSLDPEVEKRLQQREKRASVAISIVMIIMGISVVASAADDLRSGAEEVAKLKALMSVSFLSAVIFAVLTVLKFRYAEVLQSESLFKDGVCSLLGTILSLALFADAVIVESVPQAWWTDPVVSIMCGVVAIVYGFHGLYIVRCIEKIPICSCRWWFMSQGEGQKKPAAADGTDAATVRSDGDTSCSSPVSDTREDDNTIV